MYVRALYAHFYSICFIFTLKVVSFYVNISWYNKLNLLQVYVLQFSKSKKRTNCHKLCCGSESEFGSGSTGSTCFRASRIRIRILLSSCKNSKKHLDSYYFVTLFDCLSLKNDVNVSSKSNKQKNYVKNQFFCWHLEGQ